MSDMKVRVLLEAIDKISEPMRRMASQFSAALLKMSSSVRAFGLKTKEMGKSISDLGGWMQTRLTAPLALAGWQSKETQKSFEALQSKMTAALSSKALGTEQIKRLRLESDRLGVSFIDTADSYAGFAASITRAGFGIGETNKMFNDFAETTVSLKLNNEQIGYTFKALEQMASKPTVSMEELKLQLADQIPGAVQIAAKSMGMTTKAFMDATAAGEILSKDFLPKFSAKIREELGGGFDEATQSLNAFENRTKNSLLDSSLNANKAGIVSFYEKFLSAVTSLSKAFNNLSPEAQKFIVWGALAVAILGPVLFLIGQMVIGIGGLIMGFGMIAPAAFAVIGAIKAMSVALFTTPFGWVVLGIAALIGAGYLLVKNWDKIKVFFSQLWDNLKGVFQKGIDWIMQYIQPLLNVLHTVKNGLSYAFPAMGKIEWKGGGQPLPVAPAGRQSVDMGGTIKIKVDSEGRAKVTEATPNRGAYANFQVNTGEVMSGGY